MAENPPPAPGDGRYVVCPFCTLQIPENETVCPHCKGVLPPKAGRAARHPAMPFEGRLDVLRDLVRRQSHLVKAAALAFLALAILLVFLVDWAPTKIVVVPNPALAVTVEKEKRGKTFVVRGTVQNQGEDVPDLSLRSIRLFAEFGYADGRRVRKTVFPKAEFRGEGALLNGETGRFGLDAPADGLREVRLEARVHDLGDNRTLIPAGRTLPRAGR